MIDAEVLAHLRLTSGEAVRFRKIDGGRWLPGKMSGVAADGSITIHDANGAARSLRPERVEVRRPGSRGRLTWQRGQRCGDHVGTAGLVGRGSRFEGRAETNVASAPMNEPTRIDVEPDPVPIVLILAATLRRAARTPKLAAAIGHIKGNVALRSTVDPQAATMRFGNGGVTVVRGVSDDADVIIAADINKMSDEKPPKPKVTGALGHLKLALTVSKLLEPPHGTWQEEAQRFFTFATERPGIPGRSAWCAPTTAPSSPSATCRPSMNCTAANMRCSTCSAATR